jgi:hypothetical protein
LRDLARSCKLFAQEIRDHRQSLPASERHATIRMLVRSHDRDHDYYLSHASCPAKDLTVLRLEYTVLIADCYSTHHFPQFCGFKWRLLDLSVLDGLPDALDLQVFLHFKPDESSPPDGDKYVVEVVNTCLLVERSPYARYVLPKVQRLMRYIVDAWKPLSSTS